MLAFFEMHCYIFAHSPLYVTEALRLVATVGFSFCSWNHVTLVFMAGGCVTKATPIHFINVKCHIKQLESGKAVKLV